jgi:glycosyltransferase 2 family protein
MDDTREAALPAALPNLSPRSTRASQLKVALIFVKVAVTVLAIFLISRAVDWSSFRAQIRNIDPIMFSVAVLISVAQVFVAAYRWKFITRSLDATRNKADLSSWLFVRSSYIAQLLGQVAPFGAGDAVRVLLLNNAGVSLRVAFKSVLLDRAIAFIVLFAMAPPLVLFSPVMRASEQLYLPILAIVAAGLVAIAISFAVAKPIARVGARWRVVSLFTEAILDARRLVVGGLLGLRLISLYLGVYLCLIIAFWLLALGQGLPLKLIDAAAIVPLTIIVTTIPVAIAGWGLRETFIVTLLMAAGLRLESALLLSVSFGTILLLAALPGALIWLGSGRPAVQSAGLHAD